MTDVKNYKKTPNFICEKCNFECSKKQDYDRHLLTRKHKILTNTYIKTPEKLQPFICSCGKTYKHRQSLFNHKKKCTHESTEKEKSDSDPDSDKESQVQEKQNTHENNIDYKDMFLEMMKENRELHKTIHEMIPKIGNNNTTTTNNNNNQQFNLQFFLNEQCKDALNITDFMQSLQLNMNDLIQTGKLGYVGGMSRIFVKALKDMDVTERPIHCTDIKRETVYIKDQDKWEKDEDNKEKIKRTIRTIENKNLKMLPQWQQDNPDCMNMESKKSEEFMELSINALGGNDDKEVSEKKIMKNILKEVVLDKNNL